MLVENFFLFLLNWLCSICIPSIIICQTCVSQPLFELSFIAYMENKVICYTVFCATGWRVHLGSPRTFLVLALKIPYSEDPLSYLMPQNHLSYSLSQNRAEASPLLQWPPRERERPPVAVPRGEVTPLPVSHPVMSFHVQSGQSPRDFRSAAQLLSSHHSHLSARQLLPPHGPRTTIFPTLPSAQGLPSPG